MKLAPTGDRAARDRRLQPRLPGMTLGSLAATANDAFRQWAGVPLDDILRLPFESAPGGRTAIAEYAAALKDPSSGLLPPAAFLVEPIQAEGGVNVASAQLAACQVQDLAHEVGALLIFDDIQAGIGRTGSYFSFDGMGLDPGRRHTRQGPGWLRHSLKSGPLPTAE